MRIRNLASAIVLLGVVTVIGQPSPRPSTSPTTDRTAAFGAASSRRVRTRRFAAPAFRRPPRTRRPRRRSHADAEGRFVLSIPADGAPTLRHEARLPRDRICCAAHGSRARSAAAEGECDLRAHTSGDPVMGMTVTVRHGRPERPDRTLWGQASRFVASAGPRGMARSACGTCRLVTTMPPRRRRWRRRVAGCRPARRAGRDRDAADHCGRRRGHGHAARGHAIEQFPFVRSVRLQADQSRSG